MESKKEKIIEYPITEWEPAEVRVTVFVPHVESSMTTKIILGREDLDRLLYPELYADD